MQMTAVKRGPALPGPVLEDEFSMPASVEKAGLLTRLWHVFGQDRVVNFLMITAIVIGFIQGWLKYRFKSGWVTFAFDIPLTLAWLLCVASVRRGRRLFPDCNMSKVIITLTALGALYVLLPFGVPWLIALASFRAWCFIPLIFLIGYHTTRSVRQMEVYLWLLTIMGVIVSVYGAFQSSAEVTEMMKNDPELAFRLQNQFYADSQGHGIFRRFSTFVSSAAFGSTMAYCVTFAVSRMVHPGCSILERIILGGSSVIMAYGVILSGARSAMSGLIVGLAFALWYRRGAGLAMVTPFVIVAGLTVGVIWQGSSAVERFATLFDPDVLWDRMRIVVLPAWTSLSNYPLGDGLGRSGHGVPLIFNYLNRDFEMRPIDGDLGRMAVDMGFPGILIFLALSLVGLTDSFTWMKKLKGSPLGLIGLPAGSMFILAALQLFYGSPFLGIPGGMLLWFFLGSMRRLVEDYDKYVVVAGQEAADAAPEFVSFITQSRLMPLYKQDQKGRPRGARIRDAITKSSPRVPARTIRPTPTAVTTARIGTMSSANQIRTPGVQTAGSVPISSKPPEIVTKRFLFRRPGDEPGRGRPRR